MSSRARRVLAAAFAGLVVAGCASGPSRTARVALGGPPASRAPLTPAADEVAIIQTVASVFRERLHLPLPDETTVHLSGSRDTLAEALMTDGLTKDVAQERARHATAVTSPRGVFVRADRFAAIPFAERVGVIAHELAHVSQQFMRTGGPGAAAQWIREGHAEWVKYRVLDDLDIRRYGESRDGVLRAVVGGSTPVSRFPSLFGLARNEGWADALKRFGWSATYGQAFLAVDWLVERWGIERLHEFLGRFARPEDPRQHWHAVYGSGGALFIEEFRHRLETAR